MTELCYVVKPTIKIFFMKAIKSISWCIFKKSLLNLTYFYPKYLSLKYVLWNKKVNLTHNE